MFLADAESQPLNAVHIGDVFPELFQYQEYAHIVAGVHLGKRGTLVTSAVPLYVREVNAV